ncbi:ribose 5-phosphate isomerase B [Parabacteroides sp. PF5-5]|uniref:ribose 5-phosphate isomerase B n=1 Tax=unclassified Parabacteroides TaxID=2649774 RepID=UPI0024752E59|nr:MULTISPECIES: ribose 5-phosphate isomerase B [unclassified Parabacteroides]MDH6306130.1 ribose 5-phosphate isomerase B [Parabacteroides sp. PH5-39]MDH6317089.1 ribose 5-phosphate isomerase B [Parabacteroides sp. PF5-13]MDH6320842.1 ribose 5-phosphate isomerase B [Parabacteroides sp. PH5-13]MDH6324573.1 ribose 5-phosphate isomerase B [Parabacteroides sp. PH5-8]MDH6328376.1 ribose 5-phosphate isomerase B [Parabacteroides sp. PH5-41]
MKIIGLCSDHAGFELKEDVKKLLDSKGLAYKDFGTNTSDSCDYPDFAHPLASAVEAGEVYPGIAVCGTGNGIAITLNKHQEIRAALCWNAEIAQLSRAHNDANILVLPGRFINKEETTKTIDAFLETPFEGGRHKKRIEKIPL